MKTKRILGIGIIGAGLAALVAAALPQAAANQPGDNDIGGVVTGARGPEAGVWVIAETNDLPTKFVRIVVTDDQGRYLIPDLPKASYAVWVRGYGLVDSPKSKSTGGKTLNLTAVAAPNARAAAAYYPAGYWFSLLGVPAKSEFPGTGPAGNGISPNVKSQGDWIRTIKSGTCMACHQLGSKGTRELPPAYSELGSSVAAWERRVQSGQAGSQMLSAIDNLGKRRALGLFADWTDRIAAGEVPSAPRRPQGLERNVVITEWDWADPKAYLHDVVSTDRRNPSLNANGLLYGSLELSADYLPVLDPVHNAITRVPLTVRDPATEPATGPNTGAPSAYWGSEAVWTSKNNVHNPMLDEKGRVWITSTIRPSDNPAFCKPGSTHPSAKLFPVNRSGRQLAMYDPKTKK
ncbi:MAG: carboxypeptidase-like regulatory domain-containing protein, partial [bacterium]